MSASDSSAPGGFPGGLIGGGLSPPVRASPVRPSVIQLNIREKAALFAAFIPQFTDGGLFIPTTRPYALGDDIYALVTLPDGPQRYAIAGKVAWITPAHAPGQRAQGVGVRFPKDEHSQQLKTRIELLLTGYAGAERTVQAM